MRHKFGLCLGLLGIFSIAVQHFLVVPLMQQVLLLECYALLSAFQILYSMIYIRNSQQGKPRAKPNQMPVRIIHPNDITKALTADILAVTTKHEADNASIPTNSLRGCDQFLVQHNSDLKVKRAALLCQCLAECDFLSRQHSPRAAMLQGRTG